MGNGARACKLIGEIIGAHNWEMGDRIDVTLFTGQRQKSFDINCLYRFIYKALDKAEKRGRRKERERIQREIEYTTCPYCGGNWLVKETILPNGELGCSCQLPPFDAEKVRELIETLIIKASLRYAFVFTDDWIKSYTAEVSEAEDNLLAAIGIPDGQE